MTARTMTDAELDDLRFDVPRENQGQIVTVSYAWARDGREIVSCERDASDGRVVYEIAELDDEDHEALDSAGVAEGFGGCGYDPVARLQLDWEPLYVEGSIEAILDSAGEFAHGGDVDRVACEWREAGFTAEQVTEWLDAKCWEPDAAVALSAESIEPEQAAERTSAGRGGYEDTIGYKVSNGDLSAEDAAKLVGPAEGPFEVRVIDASGPGEVLAVYDDEDEARDHAVRVAHEYRFGTCIEDYRGLFDCGDGEWTPAAKAWG